MQDPYETYRQRCSSSGQPVLPRADFMARYWARFGAAAQASLKGFLDRACSPASPPAAGDSLYQAYTEFCRQQSIWPLDKSCVDSACKARAAKAVAELQRRLRSAPASAFRTPDACLASLVQWCSENGAWRMDDGTFRDIFEQVRLERDPVETDLMVGRYMQHFRTLRPAGSFDTPEKEAVRAWSQENQDWEPCRPHGLYHALDGRVCAVCLSFEGDPQACLLGRWGSSSSRTCDSCHRSFCPGCMRYYSIEASNDCRACHQHFRFKFAMRPTPATGTDWRTHCTSCGAPLGYVTDMGTICAKCESRREWTARQEGARRDDYWRRHIEGE